MAKRKSKCWGCDGSGIRVGATAHSGLPVPRGYTVIERCDSCNKFRSDAAAAHAYSRGGQVWDRSRIDKNGDRTTPGADTITQKRRP